LSPRRRAGDAPGDGDGTLARARCARVGVIADTHGLMRPEALAALAGVDLVLHAGDVGAPSVLAALAALAPLVAVRGNNDREPWADALPATAEVMVAGARLCVIHDVGALRPTGAAGFAAIVAGHSHVARNQVVDGVLYFNPGAAGPRRFRLPVSVGLLTVEGGAVRGAIVPLDVAPPVSRGRRRDAGR
jgi:putative phosphoesterase